MCENCTVRAIRMRCRISSSGELFFNLRCRVPKGLKLEVPELSSGGLRLTLTTGRRKIQTNVDIVALWSNERFLPLSLDKCGVLHCGNQLAPYDYTINGKPPISITSLKDQDL